MKRRTPGEARFWGLAEPLLEEPGITRSTMMGFPCLRIDGKFFATCDHRSGALVVKLPEARVDQLIEAGRAESFAPAGRPFREWASIPPERSRTWRRESDWDRRVLLTLETRMMEHGNYRYAAEVAEVSGRAA